MMAGQDKALALARVWPELAIKNADSHEYFAENDPYLGKEVPDKGVAAADY